MNEEKLALIGRERVLAEKLTKAIQNDVNLKHPVGKIWERRRGSAFDVQVIEYTDGPGPDVERIYTVTVELESLTNINIGGDA